MVMNLITLNAWTENGLIAFYHQMCLKLRTIFTFLILPLDETIRKSIASIRMQYMRRAYAFNISYYTDLVEHFRREKEIKRSFIITNTYKWFFFFQHKCDLGLIHFGVFKNTTVSLITDGWPLLLPAAATATTVVTATRKTVNYIYKRVTISLTEQIRHFMMLYFFLCSLLKCIILIFRFHSSFSDAMNAAPLINYFLIYDFQFYYTPRTEWKLLRMYTTFNSLVNRWVCRVQKDFYKNFNALFPTDVVIEKAWSEVDFFFFPKFCCE